MRLKLICGLLAASLASAANAGFVDARGTVVPADAAASAAMAASAPAPDVADAGADASRALKGRVTGYLLLPGWAKKAPDAASMKGLAPGAPKGSVAFGDAIFRLLPESHPAVVLDGPQDALSTFVTWAPGLSRTDALNQVAANFGLNIAFTGTKPGARLVVSKVGSQQPTPATMPGVGSADTSMARASKPVARDADAPRRPGTYAFEVRLTDIRLSVAMARWAAESNVRIRWDADKHVLISAPQTFNAPTVLDAIAMALATPGIRNSEFPLEACEYPNTPPLIRITRLGDQAKDCPAP